METHSCYDVLGVSKTATSKEIQSAYRAIALAFHPDRAGQDPKAAFRFREATEAYRVLSDPERRAAYDRGIPRIRSVVDLLMRHASGQRVRELMLPSAIATPQRGIDACVIVSAAERDRSAGKTMRIATPKGAVAAEVILDIPREGLLPVCTIPRLGFPGRNGAEPGDLIVLFVEQA